jgi:DNA adenine methylase
MILRMVYPGGKGGCFQRIINLMPRHSAYIESHLGSGAVMRHKRKALVNIGIDADGRVIGKWRREYPEVCTLVNADAAIFLDSYSFTGSELIYADPPYMPQLRRRARVYRHDYGVADHLALLDILTRVNCMVLISGYDGATYNQVLGNWRKVSFPAKTQVDVREECVWMNFDPPEELHDATFLGDTFRDRQTVRRRHARLLDKFRRMSPGERSHLLGLLNGEYSVEERPPS